jgi:hypothetical protein
MAAGLDTPMLVMNTSRIIVINAPRNSAVVLVFMCKPMIINQFTGWLKFDSLPENAMNTGVGRLVHKVIHRVAHRLCELSFDPVGRWIRCGKGVCKQPSRCDGAGRGTKTLFAVTPSGSRAAHWLAVDRREQLYFTLLESFPPSSTVRFQFGHSTS